MNLNWNLSLRASKSAFNFRFRSTTNNHPLLSIPEISIAETLQGSGVLTSPPVNPHRQLVLLFQHSHSVLESVKVFDVRSYLVREPKQTTLLHYHTHLHYTRSGKQNTSIQESHVVLLG